MSVMEGHYSGDLADFHNGPSSDCAICSDEDKKAYKAAMENQTDAQGYTLTRQFIPGGGYVPLGGLHVTKIEPCVTGYFNTSTWHKWMEPPATNQPQPTFADMMKLLEKILAAVEKK